MVPVGILLVIASLAVAGVAGAQSQRLSSLVVTSPAPGMVLTAIGNGGATATQAEAAAKGLRPATGLGYVPTTPAVYLQPRQLTLNGRPHGKGPAYWKVWWDGQAQVKASVSLQQSTTTAYEQQGLAQLQQTVKGLYPNESPLSVPNVPGATGYRFTSSGSYEILAALFGRGTNIALVSMKSYGTATIDQATFLAFASAEYGAMAATSIAPALAAGFFVLLLAGLALIVVRIRTRRRQRRARLAVGAPVWPSPAPANGAQGGYPAQMPVQPPAGPQQGGWPPQQPVPSGPLPPASGQMGYGLPTSGYGAPAGGVSPAAPQQQPPPGWYPDPAAQGRPGAMRYWDGAGWTEQATGT
jgi:hypothetical protein